MLSDGPRVRGGLGPMSYRNDLEAALARIDQLERQLASDEAAHVDVRRALEHERDEAREALRRLKQGGSPSQVAARGSTGPSVAAERSTPLRPVARDLGLSVATMAATLVLGFYLARITGSALAALPCGPVLALVASRFALRRNLVGWSLAVAGYVAIFPLATDWELYLAASEGFAKQTVACGAFDEKTYEHGYVRLLGAHVDGAHVLEGAYAAGDSEMFFAAAPVRCDGTAPLARVWAVCEGRADEDRTACRAAWSQPHEGGRLLPSPTLGRSVRLAASNAAVPSSDKAMLIEWVDLRRYTAGEQRLATIYMAVALSLWLGFLTWMLVRGARATSRSART